MGFSFGSGTALPPPIGQPLRFYQKWAFVVQIERITIGGFTKAGPLKQSVTLQEHSEGGSPFPVDYTPTKFNTSPLTLERGGSDNVELWTWWSNIKGGVPAGGTIDRRNVIVVGQDSRGVQTSSWTFPNCIIKEFEAGEFDASDDSKNIIEKMVLQPYAMERTAGLFG